MARLSFRCSDDLVRRVDEARGLVPRETWCRMEMVRAVERALGDGAPRVEHEAASGGQAPVVVPAPAEQPKPVTAEEVGAELNALRAQRGEPPVRVWAEPPPREFTPYPKGGKR